MRVLVEMLDAEGRVVAHTLIESRDVTPAGVQAVENAQNQVLGELGFPGRCRCTLPGSGTLGG